MKKRLLASMVAMALSGSVLADDTSSTLRGKITGPNGNAAANTMVIIEHVPSGTKRSVRTSSTGTYKASGLRVGGPYQVTIDSDEFTDQEHGGIYLQLGKVKRLNTQLEAASSNRMVITGVRIPSTISSGSSSLFGSEAINNQSGITRDIKDVVRANPLVTIGVGAAAPITIAGMNPRFNSFTVDGISQNDDFGLNAGGYPTVRSPLPIDALEQVTVDAAPFDAKVSGFSGGLINAVFKSGTNEFHGGVFYDFLDSEFSGDAKFEGNEIENEFKEETYGFNVAGPIIKDTLFFAVSYENYESPRTQEWSARVDANDTTANRTDATLADVADVYRIASEVYGLTAAQVGGATGSPVEEDEKYVVKLDWNIIDGHRAAFSYQYNLGNRTRNTSSRADELRLTTQWYDQSEELSNFTVKAYSDWTDRLSTEMSLTSKSVKNRQVSSGRLADVTIDNLTNDGSIAFGTDRFRHANELDTTTDIFKIDAAYDLGEHNIEFGIDYQNISVQNLFVPSSLGVIEFASLADFENRIADYTYSNGTGNSPAALGADFDRQTLAFYVQDTWDFSDDLIVTYGVRYEILSSDEKPPYNANSEARTGFDNTENLDGLSILLPRVELTYTLNDNVVIRGGFGRFSGGQPNVWISNAYSQNGVNEGFYSEDGVTLDANSIANIYGPAFDEIQGAASDGNVSFTDPNFQIPSDWRYQLATDIQFDIPGLGEDFNFTGEVLYVSTRDSAFWIDASLPTFNSPAEEGTVTLAADGQRLIYDDIDDNRYDLMLTNSDVNGRSLIFIAALDKAWDNGAFFSLSYTNQDITDVNPGTSSTARSNYRFSSGINRNDPAGQLGRSGFEIEHRVVLNLGYTTEFFEGYATRMNLFWERRSGNPLTYNTNFDRNLLRNRLSPGFTSGTYTSYIPTVGDPNVVYTDPAFEAALQREIGRRGLDGYAGGYAPKNTGTTPWISNVDVNVSQEIPGLFDGHKGTFTVIIDNALNLIASSKGKFVDNRFNSLRLYDVDSIDEQGRYVIDRVRSDSNRFNAFESAWKIKMILKYTF